MYDIDHLSARHCLLDLAHHHKGCCRASLGQFPPPLLIRYINACSVFFSEKYGTGSQENLSACRLSAVPLFLPYGSQNATVSIIPEDSSRVKGKPQFSQRISMEKSGEMAECKMWQAKHVEIQRISRKVKSFLHCAWKNAIIKVCFSEENREKERIYVIGYRNRTAD